MASLTPALMANNIIRVRDVEIRSLSDGMVEFDVSNFFPSIPRQQWSPYTAYLTADQKTRLNLGCFLVRADGQTILIDTGLGPRPATAPEATWGKLRDDLAANHVKPQEVDMVVLTHAHRDHVGWNLLPGRDRYTPTFPNARYWMSARDWEVCHKPEMKDLFPNAATCVWPLAELGLLKLVEGECPLTRSLTALPTPGHTPGHMSILITSHGEQVLILGDVVQNPAQVHETNWASRFDMDPEQARKTRRAMMERLESEGITAGAGHFPIPSLGRIVRLNGRRAWQVR